MTVDKMTVDKMTRLNYSRQNDLHNWTVRQHDC